MGYSILNRDAKLYTVRNLALATGAAIVALLLVGPFFVARDGDVIPVTHDMHQHLSVLQQVDAAVRTGALWPRWQPEFNKEYGLPWLNYYPPGYYWAAELFYLVTGDLFDTVFLLNLLLMLACAAATYKFAREFFSPVASAGATAFYMIAPYHTLDLYWRGALPELSGFFFVPAILFCAWRAGNGRGLRWIAGLAFLHGAYLMTHIPVAYLLTLTLGIYAVAWAVMARSPRIAMRILGGVAWALIASSAYWLVASLERKHIRDAFAEYYAYHAHYIALAPGDIFDQLLNLSFMAMVAALAAGWLASGAQTDVQKRLFRAFAAGTVFMITPYAIYVSKLIPNISIVSFPWRWMVIATLFIALLLAMGIENVLRTPRVSAVILAAALLFNVVTTVRLIVKAFENGDQGTPLSYIESGWVPGRAGDPLLLPDAAPQAHLIPEGVVEVVKWEPLRRELRVTASTASVLHVRTYRFRGWTARVNGRLVDLGLDAHGGQTLALPPGSHQVVITYEDPRTRVALAWVSAIAFLAALATMVVSGRVALATRQS
jgi:uncharacterized membrane protein